MQVQKRKKKIVAYVLTSSIKHEIRKFHVVVVQWRLRNVQKNVMHVQSCCLANLNLLLFLTLPLPLPSWLRKLPIIQLGFISETLNQATSTRIWIFLNLHPFNTNRPSVHMKPVNPDINTALLWNHWPKRLKTPSTRIRIKNMLFQKCPDSCRHGLSACKLVSDAFITRLARPVSNIVSRKQEWKSSIDHHRICCSHRFKERWNLPVSQWLVM